MKTVRIVLNESNGSAANQCPISSQLNMQLKSGGEVWMGRALGIRDVGR